MFIYYFKRAFPIKSIYVKDQDENTWIAHDLKVSSKRMQLFNSSNPSRESLNYIKRYQTTYNRHIKETEERERVIVLLEG
jgi:hypothetical protein